MVREPALEVGEQAWLTICGELVGADRDRIRGNVQAALAGAAPPRALILDLAGLDRADTLGLRALAQALPPAVELSIIEPAAEWVTALVAEAFPLARLHPSRTALRPDLAAHWR